MLGSRTEEALWKTVGAVLLAIAAFFATRTISTLDAVANDCQRIGREVAELRVRMDEQRNWQQMRQADPLPNYQSQKKGRK